MTESEIPTYVLAASVGEGNRIFGFLDPVDTVARALERPPTLRWAGFDLSTNDSAKLLDGKYYEVTNGARKVIRLYQDGTLVFRMDAGPDFLGWGRGDERFFEWPRLNPVPCVEAHVTFVRFYAEAVLPKLVKPASTVRFDLRLRNAEVNGKRLFLTQYYDRGIDNVYHPRQFPAHSVNADEKYDVAAEELQRQPDAVSFSLIEIFYSMFDAKRDVIPFQGSTNGVPIIDVTQIQKL